MYCNIATLIGYIRGDAFVLLSFFLSVFFLGSLCGCSENESENISKETIIVVDNSSDESNKVRAACCEVFKAYRKYGKVKIREYLTGLPPFLQESSLSRLSSLSRYEDVEIVDIRKDKRVGSYQVKCITKTTKKSVILNIAQDSMGVFKLVGIN